MHEMNSNYYIAQLSKECLFFIIIFAERKVKNFAYNEPNFVSIGLI